jgi:hypothetical protein
MAVQNACNVRVQPAKGGKRTAFTISGIGEQFVLHICHGLTISAAAPVRKAKLEPGSWLCLHHKVN